MKNASLLKFEELRIKTSEAEKKIVNIGRQEGVSENSTTLASIVGKGTRT
jgi:hypothetical protein